MKYKVTIQIRGLYEMEIETAGGLGAAVQKAEDTFNNKTNYKPNIDNYIGEAIRVERIES